MIKATADTAPTANQPLMTDRPNRRAPLVTREPASGPIVHGGWLVPQRANPAPDSFGMHEWLTHKTETFAPRTKFRTATPPSLLGGAFVPAKTALRGRVLIGVVYTLARLHR